EQRRTATGGLLWARTRHTTSRAGDPNPHDHVLVANVTEMLDERGGWKALDTGGLRDLVHAATMAGRLASAAVAVERGYAITPDAGPSGKLDHWRIVGIPDEVLEVFSKRSADIAEVIDAVGVDSPRARGVAARTSRDAKRDDSIDELSERWLGELAGIGWSAPALTSAVDQAPARPLRTLGELDCQRLVWELVGPDGPLAERKAFTRADVIRAAAPRLYGYDPTALDVVVRDVVGHSEMLGAPLTAGQRQAAEAIATSGNALDLVVGVAGSGKTTALEVARTAFEAGGYLVLGAATSGQAARTLQHEAGVESRTIASLVWRLEHDTLRLDHRTVVFVDEAGMTSDTDLLKLLVAAEAAGSKIVAIGDQHQQPADRRRRRLPACRPVRHQLGRGRAAPDRFAPERRRAGTERACALSTFGAASAGGCSGGPTARPCRSPTTAPSS
ncbi:MAG: AAA family ATPase, partial [Actinomycetota bacterium]|nr:AAA family ATPase [Actinomycetota bacterium]